VFPSALEAAKGAFSCPAVSKLRAMANVPWSDPDRRKRAYAAVIELRAFLDSQFSSDMFAKVLGLARLRDRNLPSHAEWMAGWGKIKAKMGSDGKFVAAICDRLPGVLAKYSLGNATQIFGDPVIRDLAKWGLE
jgi:hypothetical protein